MLLFPGGGDVAYHSTRYQQTVSRDLEERLGLKLF